MKQSEDHGIERIQINDQVKRKRTQHFGRSVTAKYGEKRSSNDLKVDPQRKKSQFNLAANGSFMDDISAISD